MPPRTGLLEGRVALVTGAGRGIGRAHALRLAKEGAAVVVNDIGCAVDGSGRDDSVGAEVAHEVRSAGGRAVTDGSDIATFAGASAAVHRALDAFGRIDIVVNNAGILGRDDLDSVDEAVIEALMAVHLLGAVGTLKAAVPHMRAQRFGRIINTVSEAAFPRLARPVAATAPTDDRPRVTGGSVAYAAAKGAVWAVTRSMANSLAPDGITINAISPGAATRMSSGVLAAGMSPGLDLDPDHVARVAAWLASDRAATVTGRVIHAAAGAVREYEIERTGRSEVAERLAADLAELYPA
ncbi:MAG: SDR family NAD(P)-dependent oxidoreductase [Acidimicrobiia bacterium]